MAVKGEKMAQAVDRHLSHRDRRSRRKVPLPVSVPGYQRLPRPRPDPSRRRRAALEQPGVAGFYTASGICSTDDEWERRFRNSFHPTRSGDVMLSYQPEYVEDYRPGRAASPTARSTTTTCGCRSASTDRSSAPESFENPVQSGGRGADAGARPGGGAAAPHPTAGCSARRLRGMTPLATTLCGIALRNPVLAATGTFAYGVEFEKLVDLNALGGFVVKGLSREPIEGNPPPRVYESEAGMINSIGLQNIGVRAFVARQTAGPGASCAPRSSPMSSATRRKTTWKWCACSNDHPGLAGYELNVSCPNTKHGGIYFSSDPALLGEVVTAVKRVAARPVIVKLSPNVSAIEPLARAAEASGADAISLVNTFIALAIDARTRRSADRRRLRRPFRSRDQAHCAAPGLSGGPRRQDSGDRAGRHRHRRGCGRVPDRRRHRRGGGHGDVLGSPLSFADRRRTGGVSAAGEDRGCRAANRNPEDVRSGEQPRKPRLRPSDVEELRSAGHIRRGSPVNVPSEERRARGRTGGMGQRLA